MATGICTTGILFGLGIMGIMKLVYRLIPTPVIIGMKISQGLAFAFTTVKYIRNEQDFVKKKVEDVRPWLGLDGLLLAIVCLGFILLVNGSGGDDDDSSQRTKVTPLVLVPTDGSEDPQGEYESLKTRIAKALEMGQVPPKLISSVDGFVQRSSNIANHSSIVLSSLFKDLH
ncbi:hypothetical protein KI387_000556 [Taxus chinensis]|uniref:Uncharacterized protein n=1 Tax=Taxus chinensis TaxID=29808 RepID=A0AA38GTK5_TAXCH|nr:hypothetical protein KI387_000556 [Taxus chinensis]